MRIISIPKLANGVFGFLIVGGGVACSSSDATTIKLDAGIEASSALTRTDSCRSSGFRESNANETVCPGTSTCSCAGSQICCMRQLDGNTGACTDLGACRYIAFTCDGPEDCGGTTRVDGGAPICCLDTGSGGGSLCRSSAGQCPSRKILCHSDDDCVAIPGLPFCRPTDFGTPGVEDRGLDGLIGVCSQT
jgi:hypothetical protein